MVYTLINTEFKKSYIENISALPEIKYFMIKYFLRYGVDERSHKKVEVLASELGVSKTVVTKSLNYLVNNLYLDMKPILGDKNRSYNGYSCHEQFKHLLIQAEQGAHSPHQVIIDDLLLNDIASKGDKKRYPLKLANRLLLIVLLSHADKCGVVRDLGSSDLRALTGMKPEQLKSQIAKLKKEGYIRSHISGITGRALLKAQSSVFYLNLNHSTYTEKVGSSTIIIYPIESNCIATNEANMIFECARNLIKNNNEMTLIHKRKLKIAENIKNKQSVPILNLNYIPKDITFAIPVDFEQFIDLFKEEEEVRVKKYLQLKLNEYASVLLTRHWKKLSRIIEKTNEELSEGKNVINGEELMAKIKNDIFPTNKKCPSLADPNDDFVSFIYEISLNMARNIAYEQQKIQEVKFDRMTHIVLPKGTSRFPRYQVVMSFLNTKSSTNSKSHCYLSNGLVYDSKSETELSLEEKYNYGLLTPPHRHSERWRNIPKKESS